MKLSRSSSLFCRGSQRLAIPEKRQLKIRRCPHRPAQQEGNPALGCGARSQLCGCVLAT